MHVRKGRERGRMRVALVLALLTATLVVVAAGRGGTGHKPNASAANARSGAGGFGEVYKAKASTLKKTLFNAKLLPSNKMSRNIALCELTGGRLHLAHLSTKESVALVRDAKKRGLPVTAETCPHYFTLTEDAVSGYNTNAKMNPPLRMEEDRQAILEGLADGAIDVIASDHAPHTVAQKSRDESAMACRTT